MFKSGFVAILGRPNVGKSTFLNQVKDYFSPLLEFDDPNITEVTQEYIQELSDKGLLSNEDFDGETGTLNTKENF